MGAATMQGTSGASTVRVSSLSHGPCCGIARDSHPRTPLCLQEGTLLCQRSGSVSKCSSSSP